MDVEGDELEHDERFDGIDVFHVQTSQVFGDESESLVDSCFLLIDDADGLEQTGPHVL